METLLPHLSFLISALGKSREEIPSYMHLYTMCFISSCKDSLKFIEPFRRMHLLGTNVDRQDDRYISP